MPRKNYQKTSNARSRTSVPTLDIVLSSRATCRSKRRFPTEKQAAYAAETQELQVQSIELRTYHCTNCGGWHLSRQKSNSR
ncbi:hypothetical protein B7Z28_01530 [Candidatus Saccharibacteria bacterium 32-45-3]|nr:MAG: hypothetical protein B7Z28_01530 [Candidatus Saccharibacteria bacterium 32-45-3]